MAKYWGRLALAFWLQWPAFAAAQTSAPEAVAACAAPSEEDTQTAKRSFRDGQLAFSEGDYARAAELWQSAYEHDCSAHALLLNLGMAQELLGRPDLAAQTLMLFNERAPESPYVDANQKRIARLQRAALSPIRPRRETARVCPPPPPPPVPARTGAGFRLPLVVALGGGFAAALGGAFYAEARVAAGKASDGCSGPNGACTSRNAVTYGERARARAEASGWIAGIGLAALTGGLVWELVGGGDAPADNGDASALRLGSNVGANRLGLELTGGF